MVDKSNGAALSVFGETLTELGDTRYNTKIFYDMFNTFQDILIHSPWIKEVNLSIKSGSDMVFALAVIRLKISKPELVLNCFMTKEQSDTQSNYEHRLYELISKQADTLTIVDSQDIQEHLLNKAGWVLAPWNYNKGDNEVWEFIKFALAKDKTVYTINPFNTGYSEFFYISEKDKEWVDNARGIYNEKPKETE